MPGGRRVLIAGKPAPWGIPFGGRVSSSAIALTNQSNVTIRGKGFGSIGNDVSSIQLVGCNNILITECDFTDCCQPITVVNSTNVEIRWCRYKNITGPHARNGTHRANFTQWDNSFGGSIHHNKGIGGDTEDIISIYRSGGTDTAHPLVIEYNWFEGTNWTSTSGSGMILGDGDGSHIVARYNKLLNPGQVGIGIASGTDIHLLNNIVYGEQRTSSNVGIYVWNQSGSTCSGHEVRGNTVSWLNAAGSINPAFNAGNCGAIAGWADDNTWVATINPATLHVTL